MVKGVSRHVNVRKKILDSALRNFSKNGYSDTSLRDIASDAQVSKGGLYHHFPTKEDLFLAVCSHSKDLTMMKTKKFLEEKGAFTGGKGDLYENLVEYYDKIILKINSFERVWLEGMLESPKNSRLKKMMSKIERQQTQLGAEWLKKIRDHSNLLHGYTDEELLDISRGYLALYRGILVDGIMGKNSKEIKTSWVRTIFAIYNTRK